MVFHGQEFPTIRGRLPRTTPPLISPARTCNCGPPSRSSRSRMLARRHKNALHRPSNRSALTQFRPVGQATIADRGHSCDPETSGSSPSRGGMTHCSIPLLRSTIAHVPVGNRGSRSKPRLGWCRWHAGKRRTWAILMNCGRRGFSPAMPASTDRRRDMRALPIWRRARCAKSSNRKKSCRTKCDTTWNSAIPTLPKRWPRSCAFIAR